MCRWAAPMLSPTCQYALRALVYLGRREAEGPVLARDIAAHEGIPRAFLSKILQQLVQRGLVRSQKGPRGGFTLGRPAGQIRVSDLILVVDGPQPPEKRCLFGRSECNTLMACPMHEMWTEIRNRFDATLGSLTIRELAARPDAQTDDPLGRR